MSKFRSDSDKKAKTRDVSVAGTVRFGNEAKDDASPAASVVNTGGGAYIGGRVTTGGGDFIGRDKVTTTNTQQAVTQEVLLRLLATMHEMISQAGLEERKARIIDNDVQVAQEEARASNPDQAILAGKLDGITRMLEGTGNLTAAGDKLLGTARQALESLGLLFRG
ncbi:MAG: hypothetical protein M3Z21_15415 [Pseudomonadota bacterium]|nr:hypothetical protein [Pseudomonadota bacterium]